MYENEDRTVKTAVEARGARLGRRVLLVLIVSLVAVIKILIADFLWQLRLRSAVATLAQLSFTKGKAGFGHGNRATTAT
jgi:hypothetical protein